MCVDQIKKKNVICIVLINYLQWIKYWQEADQTSVAALGQQNIFHALDMRIHPVQFSIKKNPNKKLIS